MAQVGPVRALGGERPPFVEEAHLGGEAEAAVAGRRGELEQGEGDAGGAVRVAAQMASGARADGAPRPAARLPAGGGEQAFAEPRRHLPPIAAAEVGGELEHDRDGAGGAGDDVDAGLAPLAAGERREQPFPSAQEVVALEEGGEARRHPGAAETAAVQRVAHRLFFRPGERVGETAEGGARQLAVAGRPVRLGEKEGDAGGALVETAAGRLAASAAGLRHQRLDLPGAAVAVPQRRGGDAAGDAVRGVEERVAALHGWPPIARSAAVARGGAPGAERPPRAPATRLAR